MKLYESSHISYMLLFASQPNTLLAFSALAITIPTSPSLLPHISYYIYYPLTYEYILITSNTLCPFPLPKLK